MSTCGIVLSFYSFRKEQRRKRRKISCLTKSWFLSVFSFSQSFSFSLSLSLCFVDYCYRHRCRLHRDIVDFFVFVFVAVVQGLLLSESLLQRWCSDILYDCCRTSMSLNDKVVENFPPEYSIDQWIYNSNVSFLLFK